MSSPACFALSDTSMPPYCDLNLLNVPWPRPCLRFISRRTTLIIRRNEPIYARNSGFARRTRRLGGCNDTSAAQRAGV